MALVMVGCNKAEEMGPAPTMTAIQAESQLTELAQEAVDLAPNWLKDDLALAFIRIPTKKQDKLAPFLIDLEDPNLIDEVAFTIAHLSPEVLKDGDFKNGLIVENAEWIYRVDPQLSFVDIVEYGEAGVDDDFWSTTTYHSVVDGQTVDFELPRDIYYWYVVHPRIEDERPLYIDGWATCYDSSLECASNAQEGMFWREFLWEGAAETCPEDRYCPVIKDYVPSMAEYWDGGGGGDAVGAVRDIIDYMKSSDETLGRWFTFGAYDERSIQPNRIYGLGRGNCGEWSDMTTAISRTVLIPNVNVNPSSWDHTWNAFWFDEAWIAWEPVNTWVDHPYGVSFAAYATRGDSSIFMQTGDYNDNTFDMEIVVRDKKGIPVDGATIAIFSPWESDGQTYSWPAGELGTDGTGTATFELSELQDYTFRVDAELGMFPDEGGLTAGSQQVSAGTADTIEVELIGQKMPSGAEFELVDGSGQATLRIDVSDTEGRVMGLSPRYDSSYTVVDESPVLDVFAVDAANYDKFTAGEPFSVIIADGGLARIDPDQIWYAVASNAWASSTAAFGTLTAKVGPQSQADFEDKVETSLRYRLLPGEHVAIEIMP